MSALFPNLPKTAENTSTHANNNEQNQPSLI